MGYYGIRIDVDNNDGDAIIIDSTTAFSKARPIVDPDQAFILPAIGQENIFFLKPLANKLINSFTQRDAIAHLLSIRC